MILKVKKLLIRMPCCMEFLLVLEKGLFGFASMSFYNTSSQSYFYFVKKIKAPAWTSSAYPGVWARLVETWGQAGWWLRRWDTHPGPRTLPTEQWSHEHDTLWNFPKCVISSFHRRGIEKNSREASMKETVQNVSDRRWLVNTPISKSVRVFSSVFKETESSVWVTVTYFLPLSLSLHPAF